MAMYNPFARNQEVTHGNLLTYKILTLVSWLLSVIPSIYYSYNIPLDGHDHPSRTHPYHHRHTIWGTSDAHPTPFTIDHVFTQIYMIVLWIGQVAFVWHLFSRNDAWVKAACTVGPHFILYNVFNFAFIMLWTRSHFILSELCLIINFLQLASLYFRHSLPHTSGAVSAIKSIHIPAVSMPLVWTFFAIFWNGAVMVRCQNALLCRIVANVAIWGILPFAGTFLIAYRDWTVGIETTFLTVGLGVGQLFMKAFALQWIFAFTISGIVLLATLTVISGTTVLSSHASGERAPLLHESA